MRIHFSIDDVLATLRWCAQQEPPSIFSMNFFGTLAKWHGLYGLKCNLYAFYSDGEGFDLGQVPSRYIEELRRQADWLLISYHGIISRGNYVDDVARFEREWQQMLQLFPTAQSPHMTRFHCWDMPIALRDKLSTSGVIGLLCPPRGGKLSYHMNKAAAAQLDETGTAQMENMLFWRTDVRWDFLDLVTCRTQAEQALKEVAGSRPLTIFGHEWRFAQQKDILEAWLAGLPKVTWTW